MTLCAKCHKRNATRQLWCLPCYARPGKDGEGWDRYTVGSGTGWAGGKVSGDNTDDAEVDIRDAAYDLDSWAGAVIKDTDSSAGYDAEATGAGQVKRRSDD